MLLGIPHLIVLLILIGPFLFVGAPALVAAFSWPAHRRRTVRPFAFFAPVPAGGAW